MLYPSFLHHRQVKYLSFFYLHAWIYLFAGAIFAIFSSIYLWQIFQDHGFSLNQSLSLISFYFAFAYFVRLAATGPGLWLIQKRGLRFSVFLGNLILIGYFALLYLSRSHPNYLILAGFLSGLEMAIYWTAYHLYLNQFTDDHKQGEELALGGVLTTLASVLGPFIGGIIISQYGFGPVFLIIALLLASASLPLRFLPKNKNQIKINTPRIFQALDLKKEGRSYLSLFGVAILSNAPVFWPIYIFPLLSGFVAIGLLGSLGSLVAIVATLGIGFLADHFSAKKIMIVSGVADSLLWIWRAFVGGPFEVFLVSGAQTITATGQFLPLDVIIYERARHQDLAAFILQREVGLTIGSIIFFVGTGIAFWLSLPLPILFLFTALVAFLPRVYPSK